MGSIPRSAAKVFLEPCCIQACQTTAFHVCAFKQLENKMAKAGTSGPVDCFKLISCNLERLKTEKVTNSSLERERKREKK